MRAEAGTPPASRHEELCKALIPWWQAPQCGTGGSHALTSPSLGTLLSPTSNGLLLSGALFLSHDSAQTTLFLLTEGGPVLKHITSITFRNSPCYSPTCIQPLCGSAPPPCLPPPPTPPPPHSHLMSGLCTPLPLSLPDWQ